MSFIVIEGGEGSGKGTLIEGLKHHFPDALFTREPGGTPLAEEIRECVLNKRDETVDGMTELLLVFAARAQHLARLIKPELGGGRRVICDRFTDSTFAYQGVARNLGAQRVTALESLVQDDLRPDLVVLLDLDPQVGLARLSGRAKADDRLDAEDLEFHQSVRAAYLARAAQAPDRYAIIDASESPDQVLRAVINAIEAHG